MARKTRTLEEKNLIKDINNLKRNIERRFFNIEKRGLYSPSLEKYKYQVGRKDYEYDENLLKNKKRFYDASVKGKNVTQLQTIYNRLKYINDLKTSTLKGAKKFQEKVEPLLNKVFKHDYYEKGEDDKKIYRNKVFELYGKFVDEKFLLEKFRYEILDYIEENIEKSEEELRDELNDLYNELDKEQSIPKNQRTKTKY